MILKFWNKVIEGGNVDHGNLESQQVITLPVVTNVNCVCYFISKLRYDPHRDLHPNVWSTRSPGWRTHQQVQPSRSPGWRTHQQVQPSLSLGWRT